MNSENRWLKKAATFAWLVIENKYAPLFKSDRGNIAKLVRIALGTLIIQSKFQYSNIETVNQIREKSYLQYFVVLSPIRMKKRSSFFEGAFPQTSLLRESDRNQ